MGNNMDIKLDINSWKYFKLSELFEIKKGKRLTKADMVAGKTPHISAIDSNNGVSEYIGQIPIFKGNTITVSYDGSIAEAYFHEDPYWASDSVNVLYPKFQINAPIAMFLIAIIRKEKFRFNYGRKWHAQRMKESIIKLPALSSLEPDWEYMEKYINTLIDELPAYKFTKAIN